MNYKLTLMGASCPARGFAPGKMSDLFDLVINKFSIHFEITIHMSTIYIYMNINNVDSKRKKDNN